MQIAQEGLVAADIPCNLRFNFGVKIWQHQLEPSLRARLLLHLLFRAVAASDISQKPALDRGAIRETTSRRILVIDIGQQKHCPMRRFQT